MIRALFCDTVTLYNFAEDVCYETRLDNVFHEAVRGYKRSVNNVNESGSSLLTINIAYSEAAGNKPYVDCGEWLNLPDERKRECWTLGTGAREYYQAGGRNYKVTRIREARTRRNKPHHLTVEGI